MAISSDYPRPINVNGFICRNCDDVSDAKKFIDPAAPDSVSEISASQQAAVEFGGTLAELRGGGTVSVARPGEPRLIDRLA